MEHVGQQRFAGSGAAHHEDVPFVLGDLPYGRFGPVLEDDPFDGVFGDFDLAGVFEEIKMRCQGPGVVGEFPNPGMIVFIVVGAHF